MKTVTKILAITCIATVVFAQNLPNRGPLSFDVYDSNHDNKITQSEFDNIKNQRMTQKYQQGMPMRNAGNSPTFQDVDANGDGVVNQTELTNHQQKRFSQRGQGKGFMQKGQGRGNGMGQGAQW